MLDDLARDRYSVRWDIVSEDLRDAADIAIARDDAEGVTEALATAEKVIAHGVGSDNIRRAAAARKRLQAWQARQERLAAKAPKSLREPELLREALHRAALALAQERSGADVEPQAVDQLVAAFVAEARGSLGMQKP